MSFRPLRVSILSRQFASRWVAILLAAVVFQCTASFAAAGYEVPDPAYDAPANYYSAATGTGTMLRTNLHNIISAGFTKISYGDSRSILPVLWQDPANPLHMILVYTNTSVVTPTGGAIPGWDGGVTWNREHMWPQSLLGVSVDNDSKNAGTDLFELAPCLESVNSSRSNDAYGITSSSGTYQNNSTYFFPGDAQKGDVARSMLYMATRYFDGSGTPSTNNLTIVNGLSPAIYQLGDLQSFLKWNYTDGVDNFERRKNDLIYDNYQHNRNPFIDHPEYVWAVFGDSPNSSQISVAAPDSGGASSVTEDLGRIMQNGTFGAASVAINKTGTTPTTFNLAGSGSGVFTIGSSSNIASATGIPFDYGGTSLSPLTFTISAGLNDSTATTGLKTGTITVDNTDLTTAAAGQGSQDGNDTVNLSGAVLANRTLTIGAINSGRVMLNSTVETTLGTLAGDPDDNNATRVNIANGTASNSDLSVGYAGGASTFNGPGQSRSLTVQFVSTGLKNNLNFNLAPALLSNGEQVSVGATVQAANLNYSATVVSQRLVTPSQSAFNFGTVIVGATVGGSFSLTTSGDDNNRTRVNVAGNSGSDANGMQLSGSDALFNSAASSSSRNIGGTLTVPGANAGTLSLAVSTAENSNNGLMGEGTYLPINVNYSATVLSHANASFTAPADSNSLSINVGSFPINSGSHSAAFNIDNLVTTVGFTAGLDLLGVSGNGDTAALTTNLLPFSNLAAGGGNAFQASIGTSILGTYSAVYTLNLSDDSSLPGATAQSLTLMLTGAVTRIRGDLTLDNQLSTADVQELMVALSDLSGFQQQENLSSPELMDVTDVNDDGVINNEDIQDLISILSNAPLGAGSGAAIAVPEPASWMLLCLGCGGIMALGTHRWRTGC